MDALVGWVAVTVFVAAGLLALALEVWDEVPARPGVRRRGRAVARSCLGWLLPLLVVGAAALTLARFATYLA